MVRLASTRVVVYSLGSLAALGAVYTEILPLFEMVGTGGRFEGFLSPMVDNLETVIPLLIAGLALGIVLWYLVSGAQEEQARNRVRRRR